MNICVRPAVKISLINHLDLKSEAAYLAGQQAAGAPRPQPPGGLGGGGHGVVVLRRGLFVPFVSLSSFSVSEAAQVFPSKCINALKGKQKRKKRKKKVT